jgi:hypothetical protein
MGIRGIYGAIPIVWVCLAISTPGRCADVTHAAVDFLGGEVPRWKPENHCLSCHNNGDGARALLLAKSRGYILPPDALTDTLEWLRKPAAWDDAHSNPGFSDRKLARIQFSAALAEAVRDVVADARNDLERAAELLLPLQESNGAWKIDTGGVTGAPATYGSTLATYMARRTLETAEKTRFEAAIVSANCWLRAAAPANVLDRAAILLALPDTAPTHLQPLLAAQNSDGGWGSQPHAPSEAFDTAITLLALNGVADASRTEAIARGRAFLTKFQLSDGSWPETTRPSGFVSYAERISTAGWAAYALLSTDAERH